MNKQFEQGYKPQYDKILTFLLQLYCILLPFEEALASSFGSIQRIIGFIIIGYVVFSRRFKVELLNDYFQLVIWISFCAISIIWSPSTDNWLYFFKIYAVQILFLIIVLGAGYNAVDLEKIRGALIFGGVISAALIILLPSQSFLTEEGRRTIILFGRTFDPNIVAAIMSMGIVSSISGFINSEKPKERILFFAVCVWTIAGVLFTGSRGGIISLTIGIVFLLYPELKIKANRKWVKRIIWIGIIAIIGVIILLPEELILARFSKETFFGLNELEAGSHNRYTIWMNSWTLFKNDFVLGCGCGNFMNSLSTVYRSSASHNLYILLLVEGGIIGFVIFTSYIYLLMKKIVVYKLFVARSMLITALIMALTLDSITYKYFWVTLIYSSISIRQRKQIENTRVVK